MGFLLDLTSRTWRLWDRNPRNHVRRSMVIRAFEERRTDRYQCHGCTIDRPGAAPALPSAAGVLEAQAGGIAPIAHSPVTAAVVAEVP